MRTTTTPARCNRHINAEVCRLFAESDGIRFVGSLAFTAMVLGASAQVEYDLDLTFDPGSQLALDSIYPAHLWQVGAPDKPVFDSAYSAPFALVTDTLLPYPTGGVDFAEFSFPIDYFGEAIDLTFMHRMDVDSGQAYGWIEYFNPEASVWVRMGSPGDPWQYGFTEFYAPEGSVTDSGVVFTGEHQQWNFAEFQLICIAVFRNDGNRGGMDQMRYRFAFQGTENISGRDGWMIDNVHVHNYGICSGVEELAERQLSVWPNPVDDALSASLEQGGSAPVEVEITACDGRLVRREWRRASSSISISTKELPDGAYALRTSTGGRHMMAHFLVVH